MVVKKILRWEPGAIHSNLKNPNENNDDETTKRLESVAEALYEYFCQLEKVDQITPQATVSSSPILERTGTHG